MQAQKYLDEADFALSCGQNDTAENSFKLALAEARIAGDACSGGAALRGLAKIYESKQEHQLMLECAAQGISADTHFWGGESLQVSECNELAGRAAVALRDFERARSFLQESMRLKKNFYESDHPEILAIIRDLLACDLDTNNLRNSVEVHGVMLECYQRLGEGQSWPIFIKLDKIVAWYVQQEKHTELERILRSELELLSKNFPARRTEINSVMAIYRAQLESGNRGLAASRMRPSDQTGDAAARVDPTARQLESLAQGTDPQAAPAKRVPKARPVESLAQGKDQASFQKLFENSKTADPTIDGTVVQATLSYAERVKLQEAESTWRSQSIVGVKRVLDVKKMRAELPTFLDALNGLVQSGVHWQSATVQLVSSGSAICPTLCAELEVALHELRVFRKPFHVSLKEIGERYGIDELGQLASTLAAENQSGGIIAQALKSQSEAIKESL